MMYVNGHGAAHGTSALRHLCTDTHLYMDVHWLLQGFNKSAGKPGECIAGGLQSSGPLVMLPCPDKCGGID
jgi:hypothetical protein